MMNKSRYDRGKKNSPKSYNLLLVGQHYFPEDVSGAVLATELAEDLAAIGYNITFVTGAPNYPFGRIYQGYKNSILSSEILNNVKIIRIWSYISDKKTFWRRIFNYGTFSLFAFLGGLNARKVDLVLSFSPPLPLGLAAWLLSAINRAPWILRVSDLYPDSAIAAGVLKNSIMIKFFEIIEKFLYKKSNHILAISNGFRNKIIERGQRPEKITVLPVWGDPSSIIPMQKNNYFRDKHQLQERFVLIYSGNFGHNSSLEDIINAASLLVDHQKIKFLLIGEGVKKCKLMKMANDKNLRNVIFLPYQPRSEYPFVLAASDIGLVTLNHGFDNMSLPSKIFNIMASGRPILAITDIQSEVSHLISENNCGIVIPPGMPELLASKISSLVDEPEVLINFGNNGRSLLEKKFSRQYCVNLYDKIIRKTLTI